MWFRVSVNKLPSSISDTTQVVIKLNKPIPRKYGRSKYAGLRPGGILFEFVNGSSGVGQVFGKYNYCMSEL